MTDKVNVKDLEFKVVTNTPTWAAYKVEKSEKEGVNYEKKCGSNIIYKEIKEGYECLTCSAEILAIKVAHPIWDGPFPMSGSGRCHYEYIPYCPNCEEKPSSRGIPIQ